MAVKPIPDGYSTVTPYLAIAGAAKALDFYKKAFNAEERMRMEAGDKIMHAEITIGGSVVMLADEFAEMGHLGPKTLGGSPVSLMVYVNDVDKMHAQAIAAGATEKRPLSNEFYGDRVSAVTDPFGHVWTLATHVEDVSKDEMDRRFAEMMKKMGG